MATVFYVPGDCSASSLFRKLNDFRETGSYAAGLEINFRFLRFIHPSGVVFLSNMLSFLSKCSTPISFKEASPKFEAIRYLDDCGFFTMHFGSSLSGCSSVRSTTMPLVNIENSFALPWVNRDLVPWLSGVSGADEKHLPELATCVKELFNNIVDHSNAPVGSVFAQWYPKVNRAAICIADFGRGIPDAAREVEPFLNDTTAIEAAFEDGFTSKSRRSNQGVGLFILKQNVVDNLRGTITLHSAGGALKVRNTGTLTQYEPYYRGGFCPGTLIEIDFPTDQIAEVFGGEEIQVW